MPHRIFFIPHVNSLEGSAPEQHPALAPAEAARRMAGLWQLMPRDTAREHPKTPSLQTPGVSMKTLGTCSSPAGSQSHVLSKSKSK